MPEFAVQKLEYIHNNPVGTGLVEKAEEYIYISTVVRGIIITESNVAHVLHHLPYG